jgi:hypothetical protein
MIATGSPDCVPCSFMTLSLPRFATQMLVPSKARPRGLFPTTMVSEDGDAPVLACILDTNPGLL